MIIILAWGFAARPPPSLVGHDAEGVRGLRGGPSDVYARERLCDMFPA